MLLLRFYAATVALLGFCPCLLSLTATGAYSCQTVPTARVEARKMSVTPTTTTTTKKYRVRECAGGEDYSAVIGSVDAWWGGRRMSTMLPRLFFENFCDTSFVVTTTRETGAVAGEQPHSSAARPARQGQSTVVRGEGDKIIVGFLCGFLSQSRPGEAHAHFIGVDPAHRGAGLGARLYEYFFRAVKARGCTLVHAVTSPVNTASVEFHLALGFEALRVASRGGGCDEEKGVIGGGVENRQRRASTGVQAGKGAPVDSEFVHVGYDGPDDGDRVLLEKRL